MKLHYLKANIIEQLRTNAMNNIEHYSTGESWIEDYIAKNLEEENWRLESRLSFKKAKLKIVSGGTREMSRTDAENAKLIHDSLRNLTPAQAIDERIWVYLTHEVYPEYMAARWIGDIVEISKAKIQRYFAGSNRELIRNGIARLWWYGYLTYDNKRDNPYELTELLLSNQNLAQSMLERTIGNNRIWLINMLDLILRYKEEYPSLIQSKNIKKFAKYLNVTGGVTVLDCLDKENLEGFFLKWVNNNLTQEELVSVN